MFSMIQKLELLNALSAFIKLLILTTTCRYLSWCKASSKKTSLYGRTKTKLLLWG